jgi:activating signal cointegrator 1
MKVISLLQPWASLVVLGHKKIETRSWDTKYRGPLLIHASAGKKDIYRQIMVDFHQEFYHLNLPRYQDMPFGAIIGQANLVTTSILCPPYKDDVAPFGIYYNDKGAAFSDQELAFGDYSPGRYGWLLSDPVQFAQPIPAKGSLGLWEFDMPDHVHVPVMGGHATFSGPPSKEQMEAVNKMATLAYSELKKGPTPECEHEYNDATGWHVCIKCGDIY